MITEDASGRLTLTVKNQPAETIRILKRGYGAPDPLPGAEFSLYRLTQLDPDTHLPLDGEIPILHEATDANGLLDLGALDKSITYYLFETKAPDGYELITDPVIINTTSEGAVTAYLRGSPLTVEKRTLVSGLKIWEITVFNSFGYELPSTGGMGDLAVQLPGAVAVLTTAILYRRRRKKHDR